MGKRRSPDPWLEQPLRATGALAAILSASRSRPSPNLDEVGEDVPERFLPDPAFGEWIRDTFISADGELSNEEHAHLVDARIGVLWTNVVNVSKHKHVLATAELPQVMGTAWKRARAEQQLRDWFSEELDFLLTFYAPECVTLSDRAFCAVVEHELYHCAQAEGPHGPKFDSATGQPIFDIRGHDVEEFVGVVRRYGVTSPDVRALVKAAALAPEVGEASIEVACGTGGVHVVRVA